MGGGAGAETAGASSRGPGTERRALRDKDSTWGGERDPPAQGKEKGLEEWHGESGGRRGGGRAASPGGGGGTAGRDAAPALPSCRRAREGRDAGTALFPRRARAEPQAAPRCTLSLNPSGKRV